ncbi:hypothetical protein SDC9_151012 [bioreactor metagenome]|uniref:Uncharacterized protein n=1 Tax=bioreactor metagenome TaxID=1076179 RepID=A0A645EP41_9ZZZZ
MIAVVVGVDDQFDRFGWNSVPFQIGEEEFIDGFRQAGVDEGAAFARFEQEHPGKGAKPRILQKMETAVYHDGRLTKTVRRRCAGWGCPI